MQFEIKARFTGTVLFTAEIDANEATPLSIKLGLAVRKAVEVKTNLGGANLRGADLYGADLYGANLGGKKLTKNPIQISGFPYLVTIFDETAQIGCQNKTIAEWLACEREDFAPYKEAFRAIVTASGRLPIAEEEAATANSKA